MPCITPLISHLIHLCACAIYCIIASCFCLHFYVFCSNRTDFVVRPSTGQEKMTFQIQVALCTLLPPSVCDRRLSTLSLWEPKGLIMCHVDFISKKASKRITGKQTLHSSLAMQNFYITLKRGEIISHAVSVISISLKDI